MSKLKEKISKWREKRAQAKSAKSEEMPVFEDEIIHTLDDETIDNIIEEQNKETPNINFRPFVDRYKHLGVDTSGEMNKKKVGAVIAVAGLIAAVIGVYLIMQKPSTPTDADPAGDINVYQLEDGSVKLVQIKGNASDDNGLSMLEINLLKDGTTVFHTSESLTGKSTAYDKEFNATIKEPGTYQAVVKIKDNAEHVKELTKTVVIGDIAPKLISQSIAKINDTVYRATIDYSDVDNEVISADSAVVLPGTNIAVSGHVYETLMNNKSGQTTVDLENLAEGSYDLLTTLTDKSSKTSETKRTPFTVSTLPVNAAPVIESWNIANNTKQPDLYLNVSDSDNNVKNATIKIYDSLDQLVFSKEYTVNAASKNITDTIDLTSKPKGNYTVKVEANDVLGKNSTMLEKIIELPNAAPSIVGEPMVYYNSGTSKWHFKANATDIDLNGDYIRLYVIDRFSNFTTETRFFYNTLNQKNWIGEIEINMFSGTPYRAEWTVFDKEGIASTTITKDFDT